MSARSVISRLLVASALIIACDGAAESVRPPVSPPVVDPPTLSSLEVVPSFVWMEEGWEVPLRVIARDQRGLPLLAAGGVTLSSSDTAIARLKGDGVVVVGVSPGTADITVSQTFAGVTRIVTIKATVERATPAASLVLTADPQVGWLPPVAHMTLGGTVKWLTIGPTNWTGMPHRVLYLLDRDYSIIDSLDLSTGSATKIYKAPGEYRYCSGGCWDPPDFGVIFVR